MFFLLRFFLVTGFAQKRCSKLIIDRFLDENHCPRELLDDVCLFFVIFSSFIEFAVDSLLGFCKFSSFLFMYICLAGHVRMYAHTHTG